MRDGATHQRGTTPTPRVSGSSGEAAQVAARSLEALRGLAATLAHDLRNPLNTISLALQLVSAQESAGGRSGESDGLDVGEHRGRVDRAVARIKRSLDTLALVRLTGCGEVRLGPVDLEAVCRASLTSTAAQARARNVAFEFRSAAREGSGDRAGRMVVAEETFLEVACRALAESLLDASPAPERIELSLVETASDIRLAWDVEEPGRAEHGDEVGWALARAIFCCAGGAVERTKEGSRSRLSVSFIQANEGRADAGSDPDRR